MRRRNVLLGAVSLLMAAGCAGISPVQVGQTAGTIAGAALVPGIGAPVGALVGLLTGMMVQKEVDKVTEKRERKELAQRLGDQVVPPADDVSPTAGQSTRVWIDETLQDGRLVAGHFDARALP